MSSIEELGRYRLALGLIPDQDEADRLFMEARSTKELQRLIDRWRDRQGLGPASLRLVLPVLSSEQIEHAHHLTRRAQSRRMVKRWLAIAVGACVLLLTVLWIARPPEVPRLAADPNFRWKPILNVSEMGGYALQIYQVESTTGSVTIWWGITGDGVDRLEPDLRPTLLRHLPTSDLVSPVESLTAATSPGRLVGRSQFRIVTVGRDKFSFTVLEEGSGRIRFMASIPAPTPLTDPEADLVKVDESIAGPGGTFVIEEVVRAPDYTIIRIAGSFTRNRNPHLILETDHGVLPRWGSIPSGENQFSFVFGPLPSDVEHFVIQQSIGWEPVEIPVFADGRPWGFTYPTRPWQIIDGRIEVEMETQTNLVLDRPAAARNLRGQSHPIAVSVSFTRIDGIRRWTIVTEPLPPGLEVDVLWIGGSTLMGQPQWSATVRLPTAKAAR